MRMMLIVLGWCSLTALSNLLRLLVEGVEGLTRVVERLAGFKFCGKFRGFQPWSFKGVVDQ